LVGWAKTNAISYWADTQGRHAGMPLQTPRHDGLVGANLRVRPNGIGAKTRFAHPTSSG